MGGQGERVQVFWIADFGIRIGSIRIFNPKSGIQNPKRLHLIALKAMEGFGPILRLRFIVGGNLRRCGTRERRAQRGNG